MTEIFAIVLVLAVAALIVAPLLRAGLELAPNPSGGTGELWQREKAVALLAISEADFDRATGKLSDDDYEVLRDDYEGRAIRAMDELDAMTPVGPASTAAGVARFCGSCGNAFAVEDRFCSGCGRARA